MMQNNYLTSKTLSYAYHSRQLSNEKYSPETFLFMDGNNANDLFPNLQSQKIYVSPTGSQLETGSKSQPFSSINQATEKIIKIIQTESPAEVTMYLLEGRHFLSEPLELTSSDIGNTKVNIKAFRKAHARISGGIKVIDWQQYDQNIWKAALPKQVVAGGKIRELFVNDQRATRSRYPMQNICASIPQVRTGAAIFISNPMTSPN